MTAEQAVQPTVTGTNTRTERITRSFVEQNRRAWDHLATVGNSASDPWDMPATTPELRSWVDEFGWLPWSELHTVLVLCGAGGQQAPTFARLGLTVTVVDVSAAQLAIDRRAAESFGVFVETIRADVHDLSALAGRRFDLVYQPASTCYLADPRICYANVASLLAPGGLYLSEHWNPAQIQLGAVGRWDGGAYRVIHASGTGEPLQITHPSLDGGPECTYFAHRMKDLVGGICDAGFVIERFGERGEVNPHAEPDSPGHVGSYLPSFFQILARRTAADPGSRLTPPSPGKLVQVPERVGDAAVRFRRRGYAIVRDVLDAKHLVPRLTREALVQREAEHRTAGKHYGLGHDGTYVSGGMAFTSSHPGPALRTLHRSDEFRELVREVTGNPLLRHSGNLSYMYYYPGSHIDVHTDVPGCEVTVLTSVIGQTPPLIAYPRLHGIRPRQLLAVARRTGGRPPGGVALELPVGGFLIIDGRRLPHRRPLVGPAEGPFGIAALCFVRRRRG